MSAAHTPGPWDWHGPYMTGAYKISSLAPEGGQVLDVMIDRSASNLANARLIASAPDLLEALTWALAQIENDLDPDHQAAFDGARAALARATGGQS